MYKYLFLITATFFLSSCSSDSAIDSEPKDTTLSATSKPNPTSKPKTTAEEILTNYEVKIIRSYPTLESAIAGFKDESIMTEELVSMENSPSFLQNMIFWDALVGMNWDELNNIPKANYQRMNKDIVAESGKSFCFEGMVHEIRVDRTIKPSITEALMYVPYEGYAAIVAVKSSGDILPETTAKFCGIAVGRRFYQTLMGTDSAPYLVGMFDLPENK